MVELVVAGVQDSPGRSLEQDGDGVGNRVRHPHELDPEGADLDRSLLGARLLELGRVQETVLVELRLDETERQARAPDLRDGHLAEEIRKSPDVILVRMGE